MKKMIVMILLTAAALLAQKHPWADFKAGSWVSMKTTVNGPAKMVTESKTTLVEKNAAKAVLEIETSMMGNKTKTRTEMALGGKATQAAEVKQLASGTETITVAGKSLACKWTEFELNSGGMKGTTKTWTSDAVPGGMVKSVTKSTMGQMKSETVSEVVAFEAK
jgi:hypothetical protein